MSGAVPPAARRRPKGEAEGILPGASEAEDEHPERAADHGHLVGEDVAEQFFGDEDVELVGIARELHRAFDIHVAEGDVGRVLPRRSQ